MRMFIPNRNPYQNWQCKLLEIVVSLTGEDVNFNELHHQSQSECSFLIGDRYQKCQCNSLEMVVRLTGEDLNFDKLHHQSQ